MAHASDQAASLRAHDGAGTATHHRRGAGPALVTVASGKGGVGKTFIAANVALALQERGVRCLLLDLDWGLANVDVALGLAPRRHLGQVLSGECTVQDAIVEYGGLRIIANACGDGVDHALDSSAADRALEAIRAAGLGCQVIVADTHPGLAAATIELLRRADAGLVVTTPEPTSVADTYALLKVAAREHACGSTGLVVNLASCEKQATDTARHLDVVARRFLGRAVPCWGWVPHDMAVARSVREQRPVVAHSPGRPASCAARGLAARIAAAVFGLEPGAGRRAEPAYASLPQ